MTAGTTFQGVGAGPCRCEERQRRLGDLAPSRGVDRQRVAPTRDLHDPGGRGREHLVALEGGVRDGPRHGLSLPPEMMSNGAAVRALGVDLGVRPRVEVERGRPRTAARPAPRPSVPRRAERVLRLVHHVGPAEAELVVRERHGALGLAGLPRTGKQPLALERQREHAASRRRIDGPAAAASPCRPAPGRSGRRRSGRPRRLAGAGGRRGVVLGDLAHRLAREGSGSAPASATSRGRPAIRARG